MSRRGWIRGSVLIAVLALCAVVAAGIAKAKPMGKATAAAGTLNIYGFGPGDDVQENRAAYAKDLLKSTTINRPAGDFNDQAFLTRLASGDVPDLVRMGRPRIAQYAAKGVLQPMDACVKTVKKQYRVGALKAMTYKGHIYGLPEFTNQITLIVNQSAFKAVRRADRAGADEELEGAPRDGEEADEARLEREPDADRVRPEDPRVLPAVGQVVRQGRPLEGRPEGAAEHAAGDRGAELHRLGHQRRGRLEQVQGVPRHVRLLRQAEPARQGPARVLADGELHLQRVLEQLARRRPDRASSSRTARAARSRCSAGTAGSSRRASEQRGSRVRVHEGGDLGQRVDGRGEEALRRPQGVAARRSRASTPRTPSPTRRRTRTSTSRSASRSSTARCRCSSPRRSTASSSRRRRAASSSSRPTPTRSTASSPASRRSRRR